MQDWFSYSTRTAPDWFYAFNISPLSLICLSSKNQFWLFTHTILGQRKLPVSSTLSLIYFSYMMLPYVSMQVNRDIANGFISTNSVLNDIQQHQLSHLGRPRCCYCLHATCSVYYKIQYWEFRSWSSWELVICLWPFDWVMSG